MNQDGKAVGGGENRLQSSYVDQKNTVEAMNSTLSTRSNLLAGAESILNRVDESYIFTVTERRHFPTFSKSEIQFGPILGKGGFCVVREIKEFRPDCHHSDDGVRETTMAEELPLENEPQQQHKEEEQPYKLHQLDDAKLKEKGKENETAAAEQQHVNDAPIDRVNTVTIPNNFDEHQRIKEEAEHEHHGDDDHYELETAREQMVRRCMRNGNSRYAVKRLRKDLSPTEQARAMIDLAIEAKFLSAIWHPNIVKMRGVAAHETVMTPEYFIVLDRLYGTLYERMKSWLHTSKKAKGFVLGMCQNRMLLEELLIERLLVAYDLAAALCYIHDQRLVYRDIKPENIGFDIRGDVKLFDFGLCKSLEPRLKVKGGYLMTGRTGSFPYMAPEVALNKPYDNKCDVYSFAILFWEILSINSAFKGLSKREFWNQVVLGRQRLPLQRSWPPLTRSMLVSAWQQDPSRRPELKAIATLIRNDLNDMTKDDAVLHRTLHMANRSQHEYYGKRPSVKFMVANSK